MKTKKRTWVFALCAASLTLPASARADDAGNWGWFIALSKEEQVNKAIEPGPYQNVLRLFMEGYVPTRTEDKKNAKNLRNNAIELIKFVLAAQIKGQEAAVYADFITHMGNPANLSTVVKDAIKADKNANRALNFTAALSEAKELIKAQYLDEFVAMMKARVKDHWGDKIALEPGDILLYVDRAGTTSGVAIAHQAAKKVNPPTWTTTQALGGDTYYGSVKTHHAALVTYSAKGQFGVAHSTGDKGIHFSPVTKANPQTYGSYLVFRLKDKDLRSKWGTAAADAGRRWAEHGGSYATTLELAAAGIYKSDFGPKAKARVADYERIVKAGGASSMFCSQFVIAAYQAALGVNESEKLMPLHADVTTPMRMHHHLIKDALDDKGYWRHLGAETYDAPPPEPEGEGGKLLLQAEKEIDAMPATGKAAPGKGQRDKAEADQLERNQRRKQDWKMNSPKAKD